MTPDPNLIEDLRLLEPINPLWYWLAGAGVVVVIGLVLGVRRWRGRPARVRPPKAGRPAYEEALEALEKLKALLAPEQSRQYGIESSTIIRRYIEARFGIQAPFQATEEFLLAASQSAVLEARQRELLAEYLKKCDLMKFARNRADRDELEEIHNAAVRFVKESIPENPPAPVAQLVNGRAAS
jgi:hypothetical protein